MAVALCDRVEHGLMEGHARLAVLFGERDRHQRFMAAAAVLAIPREGVDDALGLDDFPKNAALPELAAAVVGLETPAPRAAGTRVLLEMGRGETARAHPVPRVRQVGPYLPDERPRRVEGAGDDEHPLFRFHDAGRGSSSCGACGHASSPWLAACADIHRVDRSFLPRTGGSARASRPPPFGPPPPS